MIINPAASLEGKTLNNGWVVESKINLGESTGGYYSVSYKVKNSNGEIAFLKALDFSSATKSNDSLKMLQFMLDAFIFERDLLYKCKKKRMSKIVTPIDNGNIKIDGFIPPFDDVHYLIFEIAKGDIRNQIAAMQYFDLAWIFRTLHNSAVGLQQLHSNNIVHQDLKPSNILIFKDIGSKIGDLGNACAMNMSSPKDNHQIPGDVTYAPPELIYPDVNTSSFDARKTADIYLFGSLIFFLFTGISISFAIGVKIRKSLPHNILGQSFIVDLPYYQQAFSEVLEDFKIEAGKKAGNLANEVVYLTKILCNPDPSLRGEPKWRSTIIPNYDLQRIISQLDILSNKARYAF